MQKATIQNKLDNLTPEQQEQLKKEYADIIAVLAQGKTSFPVNICLCINDGEFDIDHQFNSPNNDAVSVIVKMDEPPYLGDDNTWQPTGEELMEDPIFDMFEPDTIFDLFSHELVLVD